MLLHDLFLGGGMRIPFEYLDEAQEGQIQVKQSYEREQYITVRLPFGNTLQWGKTKQ
jgi:hypothetical protein